MRKSIITLSTLLALVISGCTSTPKKKKSATSEQLTTGAPSKTSEVSPTSVTQSPITASTSAQPTSATPTSATPTSVAPTSSSLETTLVPPPTPGTEVTKTIATAFDEFKNNSGFTAGSQQIDTDLLQPTNDKTKNAAKLKTYFESICDVEGMVSDLVFHNLNTTLSNTNDLYLTFGTQSASGSITWTSSVPMKSVSITAKNYFKYYKDDYTDPSAVEVCHTDSAQLSVNNEKYAKTVTDINVEPTHQTFTYSPAETFTTLEILNDLIGGTSYNRLFLESISITFVF